jgi:hypothetical protein
MPLTAINTPFKQRDLEATARAGALLSGAGLVGVLTAGPARLCLLPTGGGDGSVVDLAVESPQDLALLSKDVAVVRAGDGHLWGFVDLAGGARAKQVGRDARALYMRPSGESALALNQDGSATAITVNRQEIGARTIAIRGALRACDVGESVTYVVFDGEGGGQFRIHPGATPELGTSAKTTLPAEARELDLVRGGQALSAVWKRGMPALCVVTGTPAKLSARMVTLDGRPADVAVIEDAMLVAFADGRLALYDADALAAAGDAPVPARSVVALTSRGKPRIALVSVTKGSAALWVGTTAGEVFRAPLARDAARIEEPPPAPPPAPPSPAEPPPPPPPQEDLRPALAARDAELAAALAAREAAATEADAERARLSSEHAAALEALRGELSGERERAVAEATAAHAQDIDALKGEHASALEEQATSHAHAIEALKEEQARAVEENARALDALRGEHALAIDTLKGEHARAVEEQAGSHAQAIEGLKAEHTRALEEQAGSHAQAIDALKAQHTVEIAERDAAGARALAELGAAHAVTLAEKDAVHAAALAARERDLVAAREQAVAGVLAERLAAAAEKEAAWSSKQAGLEGAIQALGAERDTIRADLAAARAKIAEIEEQLGRHERDRALLDGDLDLVRADLGGARARIAELEADLAEHARTAEAQAIQKDRERTQLQADLDQLRVDLTEQRAKLEKDFVQWGGRTISLEGARGALDMALVRAQAIFNKRSGS